MKVIVYLPGLGHGMSEASSVKSYAYRYARSYTDGQIDPCELT